MCCFFTALLFFGPRLGILVYWLMPYGRLQFNLAFSTFIWPFLGFIFLPWTTLMYAIIFPITGFDWVWLALALFADIASYGGGAFSNRERLPVTGRSY